MLWDPLLHRTERVMFSLKSSLMSSYEFIKPMARTLAFDISARKIQAPSLDLIPPKTKLLSYSSTKSSTFYMSATKEGSSGKGMVLRSPLSE